MLVCACAFSGQFSREDLQTLYVEPVAIATLVKLPPLLDGKLDETAWKASEPLHFGFADPTTPGTPRNTTEVSVVSDAEALYISFDCKELSGLKARATPDSPEGVPDDDHIAILILAEGNKFADSKHPNTFIEIKVNPNSAIWSRAYSCLDPLCRNGREIELQGVEAYAGRYGGRWVVEMRVPFTAVFDNPSQMPGIWKVNFYRKRTANLYACVRPGDPRYANWTTAWKPSAMLATFVPHLSLFGILYIPPGKKLPENVASLKPGTAKATRKAKAEEALPVPSGFKLEPEALEEWLRGPVVLVPKVERPLELKGDLSDPLWQKAQPLIFRYPDEFIPGEVEKNRTRVRLLTDDKFLYIGVDCE